MTYRNEQSGNIRQIGAIQISEKALLEWLQFETGRIVNIRYYPELRRFTIYLEHSEMPECKEGDAPQIVTPIYTNIYHECGHSTVQRNDL